MEQKLTQISTNKFREECLEQVNTTQVPIIVNKNRIPITKSIPNKLVDYLINSSLVTIITAIIVILFLLFNWYLAPEVMAALIVTIGGAGAFWLTKKKEREVEIRKEKNDVYREFISILIKIITRPNDPACQIGGAIDNYFLEIMNKLAIFSSNKILDKLLYYRDYKIVASWRKFYVLQPIQSRKDTFKEDIEKLEFGYYALYDKDTGDYEIIVKRRFNGYKLADLSGEIKYENGTIYIRYEESYWVYCIVNTNGLFTGKIAIEELPDGFPQDKNLISEQFIEDILHKASEIYKIDLALIHVVEGVINLDNNDKKTNFVKNEILKLFAENQIKPITRALLDAIIKEIGVTSSGESYTRYPFISI